MPEQLTLGSLFDGSGGFPLGGLLVGIKPLWASEIEPFPIRVTTKRLPFVTHYGDVSKLNGAELPPVDIIGFGSPCQNLSVAGTRSGLEGNQSRLFFEAIRIIKEMRDATNGKKPRYAVWENVPGAFSSNRGEDFRAVLDALRRIKDTDACTPRPDKWPNAGNVVADTYSIAWRVLDAQYWGVPQRRKRIYLVADFRGQSAAKILFECDGLSRNTAPCGLAWQRTAGAAAEGAGKTRRDNCGQASSCAVAVFDNHGQDARWGGPVDVTQTVSQTFGMGGNNQPYVVENDAPVTLKVRCGCAGGGKGALIQNDKSATLAVNNDQTLFVPCNWNGDQIAPTLTERNAGGGDSE